MKAQTILASLLLIAGSIAIWVYASSFPELEEGYPGPSLFPSIIALSLGLCGLVLLIQALVSKQEEEIPSQKNDKEQGSVRNILLALTLLILFPIIIDYIGFISSLGILCLGISLIFRVKILWGLITSAITALAIYGLFSGLLGVPL